MDKIFNKKKKKVPAETKQLKFKCMQIQSQQVKQVPEVCVPIFYEE